MTLPPLAQNRNGFEIPSEYRNMFKNPLLKFYIYGYQKKFKNDKPVKTPQLEKDPSSLLSKKNPSSYSPDKQTFWYLKYTGKCELKNNKEKNDLAGINPLKSFKELRNVFIDKMDEGIKIAIEILGDTGMVTELVHTPQIIGATGPAEEQDSFRWFVANNTGTGRRNKKDKSKDTRRDPQIKFLKPIGEDKDEKGNIVLLTLPRHEWRG